MKCTAHFRHGALDYYSDVPTQRGEDGDHDAGPLVPLDLLHMVSDYYHR